MISAVSDRNHQARPEGEESWVTRLPRPTVVADRMDWIVDRLEGKSVAHLGFADVGCELSRARDGSWLHARLADSANRLVGLDVATGGVESARKLGYEVVEADCTRPDDIGRLELGRFDVVLAGELIEHVDNPGGLLEAAATLATEGAELVITTPNARRFVDSLHAAGSRELIHPDHIAVYSYRTLHGLLARHGWTVEETLVYMNPRPARRPRGLKERVLRLSHELERALVASVSPYLADGLIVVARQSPSLAAR